MKVDTDHMTLASSAFEDGGRIPEKYTCDGGEGENCNPPLAWTGAPASTKSFVLTMDDPDSPSGTWLHWSIWNIPGDAAELHEATTPIGALEGETSFGELGYGGPCPGNGEHRYFFTIYALDVTLSIPEGSSRQVLENTLQSHVLDTARLMGRYSRRG